jgi:hypothetical protein
MLGDDTRSALNGAPCAVAIAVRGYAEHPRPLVTIGVGYNDTPESEAALALARASVVSPQEIISPRRGVAASTKIPKDNVPS